MAFAGISHWIVFMKTFEYVSDIRFQKNYNLRKILLANVGSGISCITGKINIIAGKK